LRKRISKNIYELDTVRMIPLKPLEIEDPALVKHFAATYALFRVRDSKPDASLRRLIFCFSIVLLNSTDGYDTTTDHTSLLVDVDS
jgi:hypothetical protein